MQTDDVDPFALMMEEATLIVIGTSVSLSVSDDAFSLICGTNTVRVQRFREGAVIHGPVDSTPTRYRADDSQQSVRKAMREAVELLMDLRSEAETIDLPINK